MKSLRISLSAVCLLVVSVTAPVFAGDRDFHSVVNAMEARYGVHHLHIPLLGLALFFARDESVSGIKLAVFEDFPRSASPVDVRQIVEKSLGADWYPFVRVHSQSDHETTLIYANPSTGKMRMMIVNIDPSEATVVELNLTERSIKQWLKEPGEKAEGEAGRHGDL